MTDTVRGFSSPSVLLSNYSLTLLKFQCVPCWKCLFFSLVLDETGSAEAALQGPAGRVPDQPPQPNCLVHHGNWTHGVTAAPRAHSHHPGSSDQPHAVQTCPRTPEGHTRTHHLLPLLAMSRDRPEDQ